MSEEQTASINEIVVPPRPEILPDCHAKTPKNVMPYGGLDLVPLYCANCGKDGGATIEERLIPPHFAFYLCDPCAEKWAPLTNTYLEPDVVFWDKVKKAQLEQFGRELSGEEIVEALKDDSHILAKLAKDRPNVTNR